METTSGRLSGADSVAQFDLLHHSLTNTVPLILTAYGATSSVVATSLAAMPGTDTTLAINTNASHVFAYDSQTSGCGVLPLSVDANGLTLIDGTTLDGMGGYQGGFQLANGLIYGGEGGIANPTTTPPSQIATLSLDLSQSGISGYAVGVAADPSLQKEFLMVGDLDGASAYGLARYDLNTYLPEAVLDNACVNVQP